MDKIIKKLQHIPRKYRPIPFWSWNDKLDPDFLKWQIREMEEAGLGGYFMHARGGLETEYLGEEWMNCIAACLEGGRENGLDSWVYDEVGWPSGFAGGLVPALGDKYHARGLSLEYSTGAADIDRVADILGIYIYHPEERTVKYVGEAKSGYRQGSHNKNDQIIYIKHISTPHYVDVLNPEVTQAFIHYTHNQYAARFRNELGIGLKGFFTDEPRFSTGKVPWSYTLPDKFMEKYGYDIIPRLPLLFIEGHLVKNGTWDSTNIEPCGYEKVRYDFWSLANHLFTTAFMKQLFQWCEAHNCMLTGHVMMEESLYSQMTGTAGSMPFYEYMHIPGMDWLRRSISNPVVPKQVSSVACQLGKEQTITETYALSGWDISFEEMKWMAESQYVNGINLMCQHLQGYTLRGIRKRDYPPSLFFQQPWWQEYAVLNDYLGRLGLLLSLGKNPARVLLLHPMQSAWIAYNGRNNPLIRKLDEDFLLISEILAELHVDYHYGDEVILGKHANIENNRFIVGQCAYDVVILPSLLSLSRTTFSLLKAWLAGGGKAVCAGDFPKFCDGKEEPGLKLLQSKFSHVKLEKDEIYRKLKYLRLASLSITDKDGEVSCIRYQQRDLGDEKIFFLVNQDNQHQKDVRVEIFCKNTNIYRLLLEDNETEPVACTPTEKGLAFDVSFLPMQSYVFITTPDKKPEPGKNEQMENIIVPREFWQIEAMEANALTLDTCMYRIGEGDWNGPLPVIKLMDRLLALRKEVPVELLFSFTLGDDWETIRELFLVLETPWLFKISVNDNSITFQDQGYWKDSAFRKMDIKSRVQKGANTINLKTVFKQNSEVDSTLFGKKVYETEKNKLTYRTELESIYIVGDFGVISESGYTYGTRKALHTPGPFRIVEKPHQVKTGDLTAQGFCFFSGNLILSQFFNIQQENNSRLILKIGKPDAALVKVIVNNKLVKSLPWAPYEVDITDYVVNGKNKLSLQLFSGNRNLLGPHHHINGEVYNVGPGSFTGKYSWVERKSEADPDIPDDDRKKDFWKDGYCFVRYGLNQRNV